MTQEHGGQEALDGETSEALAFSHRDEFAALLARPEHRTAT